MRSTLTLLGACMAVLGTAQSWTQKADLPGTGRWGAVGFAAAGYGYICTGVASGNLTDLWQWDPVTNIWTQKADFPGGPRREAAAFSINDIGYVGFGRTSPNGGYSNDLWAYDPTTNTWTQKASLPAQVRPPGVRT
ncbi:MAG: hypothetical protein IPI41_04955 [Flavobacteriales bacterium]|nr:hypothetical protein [Flavobacteriales bacterium]